MCFEPALLNEALNDFMRRIGVDLELRGQRPDGREGLAWPVLAAQQCPLHGKYHLLDDGLSRAKREAYRCHTCSVTHVSAMSISYTDALFRPHACRAPSILVRAHSDTSGWPASRQAFIPPSRAIARWKPIWRSVAAARVETRPNSHTVRTRRVGSGSSSLTRNSSWPRGRWRAPGTCPALKASRSRTSRTKSSVSCASTRALSSSSDMKETRAAASDSNCAIVFPPERLVRSASVKCVGMLRLRLRIISTNSPRSRFCSRGFCCTSSPSVV